MNTNSFGTSPSDRLTLGDRVTQVTADTGSTVYMPFRPVHRVLKRGYIVKKIPLNFWHFNVKLFFSHDSVQE